MSQQRGGSVYTTVIPARFDDLLITEALSSIVKQTLVPARVIVVGDANADAPDDWSAAVRAVAPNVEVVNSDGAGMVAALNCGIGHVRTDYVAFLDTDDLWQADKQLHSVAELERSPEADAVSCRAVNFRDLPDGTRRFGSPGRALMFTATTFRRDTFERFGPLDPTSSHFNWLYRWWGSARERGISLVGLDYVGIHRRLHANNSWVRQNATAHRELLAEVRRHANRASR